MAAAQRGEGRSRVSSTGCSFSKVKIFQCDASKAGGTIQRGVKTDPGRATLTTVSAQPPFGPPVVLRFTGADPGRGHSTASCFGGALSLSLPLRGMERVLWAQSEGDWSREGYPLMRN